MCKMFSSDTCLCNIWNFALEYNTTKGHKMHFSNVIFKKEWKGVKAKYKCAVSNCILFKKGCIACREKDKKM